MTDNYTNVEITLYMFIHFFRHKGYTFVAPRKFIGGLRQLVLVSNDISKQMYDQKMEKPILVFTYLQENKRLHKRLLKSILTTQVHMNSVQNI